MSHDDHTSPYLTLAELKERAAAVARELEALPATEGASPATGGGSLHRGLPAQLQHRFIEVRSALFERGIFDPVLVRFDTATAPQATTSEIAAQLAVVAESI